VPQRGTPVQSGTDRVGTVTSACASPTFGRVIALAILEVAAAADGAEVTVGEGTAATVRPVPLYDPERKRPRA
jgi:glycine cleavage system aminomethyltransferase T